MNRGHSRPTRQIDNFPAPGCFEWVGLGSFLPVTLPVDPGDGVLPCLNSGLRCRQLRSGLGQLHQRLIDVGTCNAPGVVGGNPTNVPFSCNLGSLAPGASATIGVTTRTLVALVSPTAVQTNQASVTSATADTNPGNNVSLTVTTNLVAA